ncbi:MAG: DUF3795 domain-containing protein [Candidatus Brocadiia bacterium]
MEPKKTPIIATCGLDCANECGIYRCPEDPEILQNHIDWFVSEGCKREDIDPAGLRCGTCHGAKADHWSADCGILACATDKHVKHCHQCAEFPCAMLGQWAAQSPRYARALARLQAMKDGVLLK